MDMLRTTCFFFLFIGFIILSRSCLCDSRRLGPMERKLGVKHDELNTKNNEEIAKLEAPSTSKTRTLSNKATIEHPVVNHDHVSGENMKEDRKAKLQASQTKTVSSKRVSRTWKVPKYSKKQHKTDQEQPGFNLDYMQPTMHPPHHN